MEKPSKLPKRSTRKMRERSPEKVSWGEGGWSSNERRGEQGGRHRDSRLHSDVWIFPS